jgi:Ca-activated chloride channel family protein
VLALEHPWALAALPLPLLAWWLLPPYHEATAAVRIPFFEETARAAHVAPTPGAVVPRATWPQRLLAPLVWLLVVAALARPQWVQPPIERTEPARDLLLAIDLSQSMEARDFADASGARVDRLTAVKGVVDEFIARRQHDRIGLIVFGQAAFPQAPLTLDHEGVRMLLAETRIGMAGPQTAIGDAIGIAVRMTEGSKAPERVLVLLTDGNDTASRLPPEKAAAIAKDHGITIHTIGIGDAAASGEDRVDLAALERIAKATGGSAFRGEDRAGLEAIYARVDRLAPEEAKRLEYRPRLELFWIPLGAAAVLAALYHAVALLGLATHRLRTAAS